MKKKKKKLCPEGALVTKTGEMVGLAGKLGLDSSYAWMHARLAPYTEGLLTAHGLMATLSSATGTYSPCGQESACP